MTPGDGQREYTRGSEARQILNDAEDDLRNWQLNLNDEPFHDAQPGLTDPTSESSIATGRGYGEPEPPVSGSSIQREEHGEPSVSGPVPVGAAT